MLGTWDDDLKEHLREHEPYRSNLRRVGACNFHRDSVMVSDLTFPKLADRIRSLLKAIFIPRTSMLQDHPHLLLA